MSDTSTGDEMGDRIREVAAGPAQASDANGNFQQHNPRDLIEVDKHLQRQQAAKKPHRGLQFFRTRPSGAT